VKVDGGQPASPIAIGVEANQVADIENLAISMGCVPNDRRLSILMGRWQSFQQRVPAKHIWVLVL
jgi:hypothetical protein